MEITNKQKAIKDIKKYEKMNLPDNIPKAVEDYGRGMVIDYIKWKFNITEDDLI